MADLIHLATAHQHVGAACSFTAVLQHIVTGRRALVPDRSSGGQRVSTYHVLHVADPSKSFFKVVCWGDEPPRLARDDHDGEEIALRVGDILLFTGSFRGNVEAQFARTARVQLLYRRDRYFNTREVRLKDFYPMIEWYKQHRHEFLVDGLPNTPKPEHLEAPFTSFRDASENTVVALRCHVRGEMTSTRPEAGVSRSTHATQSGGDFEGLLLREIIVEDKNGERMALNLWDQSDELTA
ncbi:hypothetical protein P43SY_003968 [Pythium insidiosum]|uniref:Uncharacterized protein n=1 Tax=Pythium insidiosum TaxID=114742 RepID=A0AAD5M561_PYTIN|nr:hypothetical protein P43SY_003968 [Pythium insidiosum]